MEGPPAMEGVPVGFGEEEPDVHCDVAGDREPSDSRSTAQIRRYPFVGNLSKETLGFLVINPRSLAYFRKYVFAL
jgi:hypothetical protein